ncbi:hypothetical protein BGZ94_007119 [Podila epigama]|nr:hypothetical protein BGZ94_007119 [Podila epigama]
MATAFSVVSTAPVANNKNDHCIRHANIDQLTVFGDSYSDIGNVFRLSNQTWPLPKTFYKGRFSDGPVWSEYIARDRKYKLHNYAYGAATSDSTTVQGYSGPDASIPVPGFIQQIQDYNPAKQSKTSISKTLFAVNFQGNDFFFKPEIDTKVVLANLERGIRDLIAAGAQHILIVENFDFGLMPYFSADKATADLFKAIAAKEHAEYKALVSKLTSEFGRVSKYCDKKKKVNIVVFDLYTFLKKLYKPSELRRLGITEVVKGCVSNDYKTVCSNPSKYFYYDAFHASTKIHREISKAILKLL